MAPSGIIAPTGITAGLVTYSVYGEDQKSMGHQSCFNLTTQGGVTAGLEWICDGDIPIARLECVVVEQPEQNLRYFDRNLKPVVLRDLKLTPTGRPLVAGVQMFWNFDGHIVTSELQDVIVEGRESDCLRVTVVTADPGGIAISRRVLTLSWDEVTESYVYDFACHLDIKSPQTFDRPGRQQVRFEISDPWYCDVPAPTIDFDGAWSAHGFTRLLAEPAGDGDEYPVWQMPLNHLATGIPSPQSFRDGGMLVLADCPGNNPAFEFVGDTAARTGIGVCNWGYDVHLHATYDRQELYTPICETFRVRLCPDAKVADLLKRAEPVPAITYAGLAELPRYERQASFDKALDLNEPAGALDPWPWLPEGEGTRWCRDLGRSDNHSLAIQRNTNGVSEWAMNREGEGAWTQRWRLTTGFRVSIWVRTEDVRGRGANIGLRWIQFNHPERQPLICSNPLSATNDWTQLTVQLQGPPPDQISAVEILLRLDGIGAVWFDDMDVTVL